MNASTECVRVQSQCECSSWVLAARVSLVFFLWASLQQWMSASHAMQRNVDDFAEFNYDAEMQACASVLQL